ncbi:MAG TPA: hypothetical protein VMS11_02125 [Solirubrobacterales bacterium]|nr:hypothetical protein [Solirubrobacterales bacterium]
MNRLRAAIGLCALCVVVCSAFGAQEAGAAPTGTTAFTCAKDLGALRGEHCLSSGSAPAEYGHKEIAEEVTTHATVGNEKTSGETTAAIPFVLKATVATIPIKIEASGLMTTNGAWLENRIDPSTGEHYASGEGQINFTGVTVPEPANCKIVQGEKTGEVETTQLVATTKGQGDLLKIEPVAGAATAFAEFEISNNGGTCAAAQKVKLVGSVLVNPNGATVEFTHVEVTTQGKLRFGNAAGPKAGLEGKATITAGAKKFNEGEPTNPIAATTVPTPCA